MKMRLYTPIALLLFAGLGAAGCAESIDDTSEMHQSSQDLVLLSVQDDASGTQAVSVSYTPERGWHMSLSPELRPTNMPGTENSLLRRQSSLDLDFDFSDSGPAPARYNASLSGSRSFSASVPGSSRFSTSVGGTSSFSSGLPTSYSFSSGLSTGGSCSLEGLCDFAELICQMSPAGEEGCSGAEIAQCRASINQVQAEIPPEARPFLCALSDFFACANIALRSGGNPEATMQACVANSAAGGFVGNIVD
ncbi:hypothetical protein [Bradymonas sediminis]|uniref:Uncharacterized protein n=1 Tax=Bradymonas sediminis TaxID=1548548 RepID=A0A2Z4FKQ7_9DELT|nr:hypothetical protein [Bradymonas sediminis]AWV89543.1 hypothetical protein DN745_09390 [Bradymonas sediminis]TDP76727.1 hypothetical protein DFR33_102364 [Bradymonas sediminis]